MHFKRQRSHGFPSPHCLVLLLPCDRRKWKRSCTRVSVSETSAAVCSAAFAVTVIIFVGSARVWSGNYFVFTTIQRRGVSSRSSHF
ncbi:hypothetical protein K437DRAFT_47891 [Tilletiaria anomala UBC 951]|uniref:Uncharacterized protein n=1 Tax=Tilletiaria anomala (strain ATCC 24038 / CBS 436.72 / UBC 951) TaxID=1037660 RepID=A0A066VDV1_TILAU|nr:uncharacterized protein K437DRAFT_47891 [Tilletiaria anomala UBC 951]KDN36929.1 hypothetical protein K437DRAFT_47891 [Tilletiaria anomala UBC 951]